MKEEFKVATMREQAETARACGGMFAVSGDQAIRMLDRIAELGAEVRLLQNQWENRSPTEWAYNQACNALHSQRERANKLQSQLDEVTTQRLQEAKMNLNIKVHLNERALKAEAELSELKGDRVPYAYSYNYAGCETCEGFQDWRKELSRERPPEWMVETGKVTDLVELFTGQQKPIVLPSKITMGFKKLAEIYECKPEQAQFIAVGWNAAIEAAGGIVKDGE